MAKAIYSGSTQSYKGPTTKPHIEVAPKSGRVAYGSDRFVEGAPFGNGLKFEKPRATNKKRKPEGSKNQTLVSKSMKGINARLAAIK